MNIKAPSHSEITDQLAGKNISKIWYDGWQDKSREYIRPSFRKMNGQGADCVMALSASWLSTGDDRNTILFPKDADPTVINWFRSQGILGDYKLVDFWDQPKVVQANKRPLYSVDDLPPDWDNIAVNSAANMRFMNIKKFVDQLTSFSAPTVLKTIKEVTAQDYLDLGTDRVYIKLNNSENSGNGVRVVNSVDEFLTVMAEINQITEEQRLDPEVVLQSAIDAENRSFQYFRNPQTPGEIGLIASSRQKVEADGKSWAGNVNDIDPFGTLPRAVRVAIEDMETRIGKVCPNAFGFVMCDYFMMPDGSVKMFDPGLRPTGNTATSMAKLYVEQQLGDGTRITSETINTFDQSISNTNFAALTQNIPDLMTIKSLDERGFSVMPWGYNQFMGAGIFILLAKVQSDLKDIEKEVKNCLNRI